MSTLTDRSVDHKLLGILKRTLVYGSYLNPSEIHDLGVGAIYLERIVDLLKQQLWNLSSYRPLKETIDSKRDNGRWRRLAEASGHGEVACVRVTRKVPNFLDSYSDPHANVPLLRLHSNKGDTSFTIELFVTCNGEWIVYHECRFADKNLFTVHKSVEELCIRLDELAGDLYTYSPADWYTCLIADALQDLVRADIEKKKRDVEYREAPLRECESLRSRLMSK